ncbi:MAG: inosine/xanthosine triphosphatase [Chlorobi bacterium]|nr:inosine/xanthosine triphosphatase [Chlorobiota bacterium]
MKILVGSLNPVKLNAVEEAFQNYFDNLSVVGIETLSGVSNQPINDEVFTGAETRAITLKKKNDSEDLGGDFFVGIEGGIANVFKRWFAFGGVCIIDSVGNKGFGSSAHFELPCEITNRLLAGEELGVVMDEIMQAENTKQKGGAISFFSNGVMNRKELYIHGIISALVPFHHKSLFF